MNIAIINGSPQKGGFTTQALSLAESRLIEKGASTQTIKLIDSNIQDCIGCFNCLRTGKCVIEDDVERLIAVMLESDGLVIGSPVRNGLITACLKRFIERITYILGFTLALENKYTLGIASVGIFGGKSVSRRFCGLQGIFHTHLSGFIFASVGIPTRPQALEQMRQRLLAGADRLVEDIKGRKERSVTSRISCSLDRMILKRFMFQRNPDIYHNVIQQWRLKGYM